MLLQRHHLRLCSWTFWFILGSSLYPSCMIVSWIIASSSLWYVRLVRFHDFFLRPLVKKEHQWFLNIEDWKYMLTLCIIIDLVRFLIIWLHLIWNFLYDTKYIFKEMFRYLVTKASLSNITILYEIEWKFNPVFNALRVFVKLRWILIYAQQDFRFFNQIFFFQNIQNESFRSIKLAHVVRNLQIKYLFKWIDTEVWQSLLIKINFCFRWH